MATEGSFSKKKGTNAVGVGEYVVGNVLREGEVNHEIHERTRKIERKRER